MICVRNKDLDLFKLPKKVVFTDNGAYDLEQRGISGYYAWIGYEHGLRGRSDPKMNSIIENFARNEVVDAFAIKFNVATSLVHVENRINSTDMFRVWVECDETIL